MRKIVAVMLIASFSFFTGCFTMKYAAPPQSNVTAVAESTATSFKKSVKVWYALWGAVPISENSSAKLIADNNLKEVRVTTQFKFVDYLIGIFTSIVSIVPVTMTVEGNQ